MLKKPNRSRERATKKRERYDQRKGSHETVLKLCGGLCECGCGKQATETHEIQYRSAGGKCVPENQLGLSRDCHYHAHYGKVVIVPSDNGHGSTTKCIGGREYVLMILEKYMGKPNDRWGAAREKLRKIL